MSDRTELLEAALESLPHGVAVADAEGDLALWNRAAEELTGYSGADLVGRPVRFALETLLAGGTVQWTSQTGAETMPGRGSLVHVQHRQGHEIPAMVRVLVLRNALGGRIGMAAIFHPAERLDALPHGEWRDNEADEAGQADLQDRLEAEFAECARSRLPFGVLWITVDQAQTLRKTHGKRACEAMLEKVAHVVGNGLRSGEEAGRWGDDEFLVISHERSPETLAAHGQVLAGLARTADFRWWGDRLSLSLSVGAAHADGRINLAELLERAQSAMRTSISAGGNHVTLAQGRLPCSPL
jgi:PAS domain S-box-containing protein/diguanylate cyclase (GGDEF)-like protein